MEVVIPIGKLNPSWDLGVDMRIHIVQDFNDALLVRLKCFWGRGGCLFAVLLYSLHELQCSPPGVRAQHKAILLCTYKGISSLTLIIKLKKIKALPFLQVHSSFGKRTASTLDDDYRNCCVARA